MKVDKTAQDVDLSSIPGEFRENYRFLSELINCKNKNTSASQELEQLVDARLSRIRGKLNRRQIKILTEFVIGEDKQDPAGPNPPVPPELEASIRLRKRATWLPWEAEAIRKIERWRGDIVCITKHWTSDSIPSSRLLPLKKSPKAAT